MMDKQHYVSFFMHRLYHFFSDDEHSKALEAAQQKKNSLDTLEHLLEQVDLDLEHFSIQYKQYEAAIDHLYFTHFPHVDANSESKTHCTDENMPLKNLLSNYQNAVSAYPRTSDISKLSASDLDFFALQYAEYHQAVLDLASQIIEILDTKISALQKAYQREKNITL